MDRLRSRKNVKKESADIAVHVPLSRTFHYGFKAEDRHKLIPGVRVVVPFRNRELPGVFLGFSETDIEIKEIRTVLDETPMYPPHILELSKWVSTYYICGLGELLKSIGPRDELKKRSVISAGAPVISRGDFLEKILPLLKKPLTVETLASKTKIPLSVLEKSMKPHLRSGDLKRTDEYYFRKSRTTGKDIDDDGPAEARIEKLNASQELAFSAIATNVEQQNGRTTLLFGVTGSGKTEVYINLCAKALELGGSAIVLVPEIALTYQLVRRFRARFGDICAVLHSGLSDSRRRDEWFRIDSGSARVVVGARSAIFAPVRDLKLVVVDEENDPSYKQTEHPHYNARDVAVMVGKLTGAAVVLGSATPSLETFHNAMEGKYSLVRLPERIDGRTLPAVEITKEEIDDRSVLPTSVIRQIQKRFDAGEQSLIFINRRGSSRHLKCAICGEFVTCPNCSITLTFHTHGTEKLLCHYCGYSLDAAPLCGKCSIGKTYIRHGIGSQKVESFLKTLFPKAVVARLDQDTAPTREKTFEILRDFETGKTDILVGTQMVAKGHDFANLTYTAIAGADDYLAFPDFRSAERTFALITQAAGRTGRGKLPGEVSVHAVIDHYAVLHARTHDYEAFYREEAEKRKITGYPPFTRLIGIRFDSTSEDTVKKGMNRLASSRPRIAGNIAVLGPVPALVYKLRNRYRWKMLLKGTNIRDLHNAAVEISNLVDPRISVSVDVDPVGFF